MRNGLFTVDKTTVTVTSQNSPLVQQSRPTASDLLPGDSGYAALGTRSRLRTKTCPLPVGTRGQAFWDDQMEVINYHVVPHGAYDSYIQGDRFRIDTDSEGRPIFVELEWDKTKHLIVSNLTPPRITAGAVRLLDLRIRYHERLVSATPCHSVTYIDFGGGPAMQNLILGAGLILSLGDESVLGGLWIIGAIRDRGGRLQSRWRSEAWARVRKEETARPVCASGDRISSVITPKVY